MHQFRHSIQFLVVIICLAWGGQQVKAEVFAQPGDQTAVVSETDKDIEAQYPDLPAEVAHSIQSVVATQQLLNDETNQGLVASGVVINDQQFITAGHTVGGDGRLACDNMSVVSPGLVSRAATSKDAVSHASFRYSADTDLAVLTLRDSENFRSLPNITIATERLKQGDTVYFINFQPTADGHVRNPLASESASNATDYSKPAVFSGVVVKNKHNQAVIATGYSKSYGLGATDNMVRKGASGGAIVNVRGELVGLSVASESLQANRTAASIAAEYGTSLPDTFRYQIAYAQPVSHSLIKFVQSTTVSCN